MSSLQAVVGKLEGDKLRAEQRIKRAIRRINKLATMDDLDALIACVSDVECILKGRAVKGTR